MIGHEIIERTWRWTRRRAGDEQGQVLALTAVLAAGFLLFMAVTVDLGGWFQRDRHVQSGADAAALAGAQVLGAGGSPGAAQSAVASYASQNGVSVSSNSCSTTACSVTTFDSNLPNNFSQSLVPTPTAQRSATAQIFGLTKGGNVIPITVNKVDAVPGSTVTFQLDKNGYPSGNFSAIDLCGAPVGQIQDCVPTNNVNLANYTGAPGAGKVDKVFEAAQQFIGTVILIPVYSTAVQSGSNATFTIVGFAAFLLTSLEKTSGNQWVMTGTFQNYVVDPIKNGGGPGAPNYGAVVISLTA
jgi:Flp pilus assembly protein TadG